MELRLDEAIDGPDVLQKIEAESDAIVLAVGLGKDVEARFSGDHLPGVWDSLPFIEAIKTGLPRRSASGCW